MKENSFFFSGRGKRLRRNLFILISIEGTVVSTAVFAAYGNLSWISAGYKGSVWS